MSTENNQPAETVATVNSATDIDVEAVARQIILNGTASVSVGGRTVSFISVNDLINWIKFERSSKAGDNPAGALRFAKMNGGSTRW